MPSFTPAQRLGTTANLIIFLGLLYTLLHLLAFLGVPMVAGGGYGLPGLGLTLSVIGLGYGIRHGSTACLYTALAVFAVLSLYFASLLVLARTFFPGLRLLLSTWAFWRLWRVVPLMKELQHEKAFPLPMSSYGAFFLRRRGRHAARE